VVYPERETGFRVAHSFAAPGVSDYLDAAPGYGVARIMVTGSWIGKRLDELDLRGTCGLTAVLISRAGDVITDPPPSFVLRAEDALIVHGLDEDLERLPGSAVSGH
jgi:trk system potassium uptake protein TrkA